jgi:D-3-phosphoglycerate dehydrogenase
MKSNAIIINTSRAAVVNSLDLIYSIKNNIISGAALDVIDDELNFGSSDLFYKAHKNYDNLIITPHIGGNTFESFKKTEQFVFNKLIEEIDG